MRDVLQWRFSQVFAKGAIPTGPLFGGMKLPAVLKLMGGKLAEAVAPPKTGPFQKLRKEKKQLKMEVQLLGNREAGNGDGKVLRIGLPKGSLEKSTFLLLERAGYKFSRSERSYFPASDDPELSAALIRAQEIAGYVHNGMFDAGITGRDWILENEADVVEVAELEYSKQSMRPVRWVVAVPAGSPVKSLRDLQGKRVATELVGATRRYLSEKGVDAEVVFSWGATEVKVPALADAIVEVTETGRSLKANNLTVIETILTSTPRLIANKGSMKDNWKRSKIERMALLIGGAINSMGRVGLKFNLRADQLEEVRDLLPAMKRPTVSSLTDSDWVALEIIVEEAVVRKLIPELKLAGACDIIEYPLNKVIY